ncbi:hypothetical protein [Paraburkholderia sp.]|uniref:hypothetical protein n=1 Tax=Paraburkholderia sp. TaxID=1926495 RepID=UPI00238C3A65|nr:hypothetical protein [Paraburkholderia sp.]MDE1180462.1 hypothetical protein [Paraburkholderia sp.]
MHVVQVHDLPHADALDRKALKSIRGGEAVPLNYNATNPNPVVPPFPAMPTVPKFSDYFPIVPVHCGPTSSPPIIKPYSSPDPRLV